jgi:hypothetical protein
MKLMRRHPAMARCAHPGVYMVSGIRGPLPAIYRADSPSATALTGAAPGSRPNKGRNDVTNQPTDYDNPGPVPGPTPPPYGAPNPGGFNPAGYNPNTAANGSPGAASPIAFDPAALHRFDWAILGAGLLAMLFSFFDYYTFSASDGIYSASASASAWHGFFGWFGALCAFAAAGVLLVQLLGRLPANLPGRLLTLGGFALATLCVLLAFVIHPGTGYVGAGFHAGHGFSYWVSLIVVIVGLGASYQRFAAEGGVLPWKNRP